MLRRTCILLGFVVLFVGAFPWAVAPVHAAILVVDDDGAQCPTAAFATIQAAITAAAAGDTITVCPGSYAEQLRFDPGKDGITVRAQTPETVEITPPDALANFDGIALITVQGARRITIDGLRLTGPVAIGLCVPTPLSGLLVEGGGSATMRRTMITAMQAADPALRAGHCSPGYGILVRATAAEPRTEATLIENQVEQYLTSGIRVEGAGAVATIQQNRITSPDSPAPSGRTSIDVRAGGGAVIQENDLGGNGRAGLGLGEAPTVGIRLTGVSGVQLERNRITGSDHGIALTESTGSTLRANQVQDYGEYGIVVFAGSQRNVVSDNRLGPATGAPLGSPTAGVSPSIFPDMTTPSSTAERPLVAIDCLDATVGEGTAGTANQWQRNSGITAIPTGLCGQS